MRPSMPATMVVATLALAACSREQTGNQDFVTFGVIPFLISTASVQSKADAHCAQYGRQAALADDFGLTMKFDCVEPAKPAVTPFVP